MTVTNASTTAWNGWTLGWTFAAGQTVGRMWNAVPDRSGTAVTARNAGWTGTVAPGGSASFGFTGGWTGTNPVPVAFPLGGAAGSTG
ncbi:cellulose binding domain-containing protein [Streptomyces sp. NPDC002262]|uniref:cellulose binding domain-containing protein n=1 Tax=unclassified Streptomyces TaxID=2593676 RepID=UPI003321BA3F